MFKFVLLLSLAATASWAAPSSKIESRLAATLAFGDDSTANILVSFPGTTDPVLEQFKTRSFANKGERRTAVADALRANSDIAQKAARTLLDSLSVEYEVFWITNQIYIRGADAKLVSLLAALPSVSELSEEFEVTLIPHHIEGSSPRRGILAEWGIENIKAPEAWALPNGNMGEGAVVAGIDTGVLATHVDLAANFRGVQYGWRDVTLFGTQVPRDDNGHGTHTMGTIVGLNGIGVAPGAKWIACKALNGQGSGTNAGLISCGQWVACPTLPNGNTPDCTQAPDIVSNSWGGGQQNAFYNQVINEWHAAGIIPVFANGNSGPACTTANSPADSLAGVIGVGATTITNEIATFSSKGPTVGGRQKPDISAPGANVRSAWHTPGTDAYNTISGTSMAAPHIAGVVALMMSENPDLTMNEVNMFMWGYANTAGAVSSGMNCGNIDESIFPNMAFGYGIADAEATLRAVIASRK